MQNLIKRIQAANKIILSTHRQCDGDGLGAELGLFFALKKMGKDVRVINVDSTPRKYRFLEPDRWIQYFDENPKVTGKADLTLIFDTNDERLLEPLYSSLVKASDVIAFVDHHPVLSKGPSPSKESYIDITSASTGELVFRIIKELKIPIDLDIARCLYTSIAFDTQLFRFIRNSPNSHRIAAELLEAGVQAEEVHRSLFGNQTVQKMAFLAKTLGQIEYFCDGRLAVLKLRDKDLFHYNLESDDSRDVIDMLMNIETLEAAVLFREDATNEYKLSLRSKGDFEVLSVAENFGGGGHNFASGAFVKGDFEQMKTQIVKELTVLLGPEKKTAS
jgi:phosphoesterase RecJ-like protein